MRAFYCHRVHHFSAFVSWSFLPFHSLFFLHYHSIGGYVTLVQYAHLVILYSIQPSIFYVFSVVVAAAVCVCKCSGF